MLAAALLALLSAGHDLDATVAGPDARLVQTAEGRVIEIVADVSTSSPRQQLVAWGAAPMGTDNKELGPWVMLPVERIGPGPGRRHRIRFVYPLTSLSAKGRAPCRSFGLSVAVFEDGGKVRGSSATMDAKLPGPGCKGDALELSETFFAERPRKL